ncbi:pre-rRNA-processing protein TSR2 homolog [Amblyraja radiata]|uniref:pre-rRNA-processing protein TSR2 homolog n=1 Tax=Amblyraja radiata TaxID=386614 RepID=UPI00140222EB|nr:pre-rRNA-processing protein TSR2 homolog [Amblyraja radiata]
MAAPRPPASGGLFAESVAATLGSWPALQIALENGFGGVYGQQKADWMVTAVERYFLDNADLDRVEVEELLAELLDNEFDTVVEDGSVLEVAEEIWTTFALCRRGQEAEVRGRIQRLVQRRRSVRVEAVAGTSGAEGAGDEDSEEEEDEEDGAEAMDCESQPSPGPGSHCPAAAQGPSEEKREATDEWTVVRRKRK